MPAIDIPEGLRLAAPLNGREFPVRLADGGPDGPVCLLGSLGEIARVPADRRAARLREREAAGMPPVVVVYAPQDRLDLADELAGRLRRAGYQAVSRIDHGRVSDAG